MLNLQEEMLTFLNQANGPHVFFCNYVNAAYPATLLGNMKGYKPYQLILT